MMFLSQPSQPSQDWEEKHQHRYQRVVFSRPDFHWTAPHLPSSFLSLEHIWIMDGQDMKFRNLFRKIGANLLVAVKMDADGWICQVISPGEDPNVFGSKVGGCGCASCRDKEDPGSVFFYGSGNLPYKITWDFTGYQSPQKEMSQTIEVRVIKCLLFLFLVCQLTAIFKSDLLDFIGIFLFIWLTFLPKP